MQERIANNRQSRISPELQEYINELVKEVVLNGKDFNSQKKWLKKYVEAENGDFDTLNENLEEFIEALPEYKISNSKFMKKQVEMLAKTCYITNETFSKLSFITTVTEYLPPVYTTKSLTRSYINQDAHLSQHVESVKATVIAIADGLRSHRYAEKGSQFVVEKVIKLVVTELENNNTKLNYNKIFHTVQQELDEYVAKTYANDDTIVERGSFGTTLILGIDFPDKFVVAYIGNGSAFNISGHFSDFSEAFYLPWNSINVLNPHTVEQDGKEALYKLFSWKGTKEECTPSVIELQKNNDSAGQIFILTTDGVYSSDHVVSAKDEDGNIITSSTPNMKMLYRHLKKYLLETNSITNDNLGMMLEDYLVDIKCYGEMHDDTTLGIIITSRCIKYYSTKKENVF